MSAHTPGPWRAYLGTDSIWVEGLDPNASVICDIVIRGNPATDAPADEDYSNANLIAAAPDLLEALRALVNHPGPCSKSHKGCARGRAAIEKAEGRS